MHPDGDELLYVIDGRMRVQLELSGGDQVVEVDAGHAIVVPRGTWHLILPGEPTHIVNITPGPNGPHGRFRGRRVSSLSARRPAQSRRCRT